MGHLSKLQDEYGDKGLTIIALTGEPREMNLRYMIHNDPGFTYKVALGGGGAYGVKGVPHAYLIGPDGKVVWEGSPGSLSEKKDLKPLLKDVAEPEGEELERRAKKMFDFAEALAADGLVLRAEGAYETLLARFPKASVADQAKERKDAMSGGDNEAEYKAQAEIAKIVGGVEAPDPVAKKLKGKQIERGAKKLQELSEELAESAPRSAKLAAEWAALFAVPWQ